MIYLFYSNEINAHLHCNHLYNEFPCLYSYQSNFDPYIFIAQFKFACCFQKFEHNYHHICLWNLSLYLKWIYPNPECFQKLSLYQRHSNFYTWPHIIMFFMILSDRIIRVKPSLHHFVYHNEFLHNCITSVVFLTILIIHSSQFNIKG